LQVSYYLARIEPFSILYAQLQGAKFDHDDCAFSDIAGTWNSVLEGMNDVKELVSFGETCASWMYFPLVTVHSALFGSEVYLESSTGI